MYCTANPCADAERYENACADIAEAEEAEEMRVFRRLKEAFIEGLQWGPKHTLDTPQKMAKRDTAEALFVLQDEKPDLIDRALCMLAQISDPAARDVVDDLAEAWAMSATREWRELSNR